MEKKCEPFKNEEYWIKEGPKTASFLLIIPGLTIAGYGLGQILEKPLPYTLIGFGLSLVLWGLIVVFRK